MSKDKKRAKTNKTYYLKVDTIRLIEMIEEKTGLKKSTILDKGIEKLAKEYNIDIS